MPPTPPEVSSDLVAAAQDVLAKINHLYGPCGACEEFARRLERMPMPPAAWLNRVQLVAGFRYCHHDFAIPQTGTADRYIPMLKEAKWPVEVIRVVAVLLAQMESEGELDRASMITRG